MVSEIWLYTRHARAPRRIGIDFVTIPQIAVHENGTDCLTRFAWKQMYIGYYLFTHWHTPGFESATPSFYISGLTTRLPRT